MFNKTSKSTSRSEAPAAPPPLDVDAPSVNLSKTPQASARATSTRGMSTLGAGIVVEGNVSGQGDLVLEGTVHGDVKVTHLTVGEAGNIEGKVEAETIEIRGRVVGSIKGSQIKLNATAYVEGDITHEQISIDVGAYFQGRCLQTRPAQPAVSPSTSAPAAPVNAGSPALGTYDMSALSDLKSV